MMFDAGVAARLEKAAIDAGFDLGPHADGDWLLFSSTQAPIKIWLTAAGGDYLAALSRADVIANLRSIGRPVGLALPVGAAAALAVGDAPALHQLLGRAFQLARSLPTVPLEAFKSVTAALPRTTEAERLVVQRVGQDIFRSSLLDFWQGRCAVTGLAVPVLLRASHAKPWADCQTDADRLDVFNGLLLAAHLDAAFDAGLISVADDSTIIVSGRLDAEARRVLGLDQPQRVAGLAPQHQPYLAWQRDHVFKG